MRKIILGKTGLEVTELCFGVLPIGPLQKNIPVEKSANVIAKALKLGINFFDTAQGYKTYPHLKKGIELAGIRPVISSKSPASTYDDMKIAVEDCLKNLDVDYVDIFLLHAARVGTDIFEKRAGALECLLEYKSKGLIKAAGISTHNVQVVELSAKNKDIDIVFPILNIKGLGILEGTVKDMENAIQSCYQNNKGVFLMKSLGGGNLVNSYDECVSYVRNFTNGKSPIAMGMVNDEEVQMNVDYFDGKDMTDILKNLDVPKKTMLVVKSLCKTCGECVNVCHSNAISLQDKAVIDEDKCVTCGYCVSTCPEFAIRMV